MPAEVVVLVRGGLICPSGSQDLGDFYLSYRETSILNGIRPSSSGTSFEACQF